MSGFNEQGLTIIELVATISVIAILAVAAVPTYTHFVYQNRVKGASEGIYNFLVLARQEAIKKNTEVRVIFQPGSSDWCYGVTTDSSCDCSTANACNLGQVSSTDFKDVVLTVNGFSSNAVTFEPTRGEVSEIGSVTLSSGSYAVQVNLQSIGLVDICSNNVSGYEAC